MRTGGLITALVVAAAALAAHSAGGAADPAGQGRPAFRVLVFTKTTGYRHDSIAPGVAAIGRLGGATVSRSTTPRTRPSSATATSPATTR